MTFEIVTKGDRTRLTVDIEKMTIERLCMRGLRSTAYSNAVYGKQVKEGIALLSKYLMEQHDSSGNLKPVYVICRDNRVHSAFENVMQRRFRRIQEIDHIRGSVDMVIISLGFPWEWLGHRNTCEMVDYIFSLPADRVNLIDIQDW